MPGNVSASLIKFRYSLTCQVSHTESEIDLASISCNLDYIHLHSVTSLLLFYSTIPNGSSLSKYTSMCSLYDQGEKKKTRKWLQKKVCLFCRNTESWRSKTIKCIKYIPCFQRKCRESFQFFVVFFFHRGIPFQPCFPPVWWALL